MGIVNLLAKAHTHVQMKAIGVKATVITQATLVVGLLNLKEEEAE